MSMRSFCPPAALLLGLTACQGSAASDEAFGRRVRAYLLSHPEVIQQAAERLQVKEAREDAAQQHQAQAELPRLRAAIERDSRDFVANPNGSITVTEFYDYRCPHCANVAPKVLALIRANPDIRFVFKEMPIFGPTSEEAARTALAVKAAGGDYLRYYGQLMAAHPVDQDAIARVGRQAGAKAADAAQTGAFTRQLDQTADLFNKLDLGGTPAFIVGDTIIPGEDVDALNAAIAKQRAGARASKPRPT